MVRSILFFYFNRPTKKMYVTMPYQICHGFYKSSVIKLLEQISSAHWQQLGGNHQMITRGNYGKELHWKIFNLQKKWCLSLETDSCDFSINVNKMFPYIYISISSSSVNCCVILIRLTGRWSLSHQSLGEGQEQTHTIHSHQGPI